MTGFREELRRYPARPIDCLRLFQVSVGVLLVWSVVCFGADLGNGSPPAPVDDCEAGTLTPGVHPAVATLALGMGDLAASTQPAAPSQPVYFSGSFATFGEPVAAVEVVTFRRQGLFARIRANRQERIAARRGVVEAVPVQFVAPPMQAVTYSQPVAAAPAPAPISPPAVYQQECFIDQFGRQRCRLVRVQ